MAQQPKLCLALDLGTTYTTVALATALNSTDTTTTDPTVEVIANPQGNRQTPTTIAYNVDHNNELQVGESTERLVLNNKNAYQQFVPLVGYTYKQIQSDATLQKYAQGLSYPLVAHQKEPAITVDMLDAEGNATPTTFTLSTLLQNYIQHIKHTVEQHSGKKLNRCTLSVRSNATEQHEEAVKAVAERTGLQVMRVIPDAVAACVAYNLDVPTADDTTQDEQYAVVIDISGMEMRVTVLGIHQGIIRTINTYTYTEVSGAAIDEALAQSVCQDIKRQKKWLISKSETAKSYRKLQHYLRNARHILSSSQQTQVHIESLYDGMDYSTNISRSKFESTMQSMASSVKSLVSDVLSKLSHSVHHLILAGGAMKTPIIQSTLTDLFNQRYSNKCTVHNSITTDEVVAKGLGIHAAVMGNDKERDWNNLLPVSPSLALPLSIAFGCNAADKAPCYELISSMTPLPYNTSLTATTSAHQQSSVSVHLYEGHSTVSSNNHLLGTLILSNLKSQPAGLVRLLINVDVSVDGNITLSCSDADGSATEVMTIVGDDALPQYAQKDIDTHITDHTPKSSQLADRTNLALGLTLYNRLQTHLHTDLKSDDHHTVKLKGQLQHVADELQKLTAAISNLDNAQKTTLEAQLTELKHLYNHHLRAAQSVGSLSSSSSTDDVSTKVNDYVEGGLDDID